MNAVLIEEYFIPTPSSDFRAYTVIKTVKSPNLYMQLMLCTSSQLMGSEKPVTRKPLRRPSSAKKLPPISEQTVITAAAVSSLREVSEIWRVVLSST